MKALRNKDRVCIGKGVGFFFFFFFFDKTNIEYEKLGCKAVTVTFHSFFCGNFVHRYSWFLIRVVGYKLRRMLYLRYSLSPEGLLSLLQDGKFLFLY